MNYDRNAWGLSVTLLYNIYGPRIIRVGAGGLDDTYEQPVGRFDAVVKKTFGAYGALKAGNAKLAYDLTKEAGPLPLDVDPDSRKPAEARRGARLRPALPAQGRESPPFLISSSPPGSTPMGKSRAGSAWWGEAATGRAGRRMAGRASHFP